MSYYDTRPVVFRPKYKSHEGHYVMTAAEVGRAVTKALMESDVIGIQVFPVMGLGEDFKRSIREEKN
jgi:hypothetical protein